MVVFAETRGKAISLCLGREPFDDYEFTELYARRFKDYDKYYDGNDRIDWDNEEHRLRLVRDFGWACTEGKDIYCEDCCAKKHCREWEDLTHD